MTREQVKALEDALTSAAAALNALRLAIGTHMAEKGSTGRVEAAVAPAPAPAPAPLQRSSAVPEQTSAGLSLDDLRTLVKRWAQEFADPQWMADIMDTISGTHKLRDIDPSHYGAIIAEVERQGKAAKEVRK